MSEGRSVERVAILSIHSHGDRSFLDDRELAILAGDLRQDGLDSRLVLAAFGRGEQEDREVEGRLVEALRGHDVVVFERTWSKELIERLRGALPGRVFVHARGEHELEDPPADYLCAGDLRRTVPLLLSYLRGEARQPPEGTRALREGAWVPVGGPSLAPPRVRRYAPDLRPLVINPEGFPPTRTFSIQGNGGCPYQADARENPVYAGVEIPRGVGRGCAFCTTGNHYEGRPARETAASVLEQLRYLRSEAPELTRIVLKDQNPFAYLTEVVKTLAAEQTGVFTLLLETRADWLLRSARRFEEALAAAGPAGLRISPFLVGIESFSQPELDRYNKGISAETNVAFLEWLWALKGRFGEVLDLESASFGFVLFSPWTTLDDLETNLQAIRRTRFDRLRGRLLLSRARLYPDTALHYLARRDGLLVESFREGEDSSRRYGYYPAPPWRFLREEVAHFAALATALTEERGGRDEVALFAALIEAFRGTSDFRSITAQQIRERLARGREGEAPPPAALRARFERLVRPLSWKESFAGGWSFGDLSVAPGRLRVELRCPGKEPFSVEIAPRGEGPRHARSRHYDIRAREAHPTAEQRAALDALCAAILANDR
jgi:hypothetical protein